MGPLNGTAEITKINTGKDVCRAAARVLAQVRVTSILAISLLDLPNENAKVAAAAGVGVEAEVEVQTKVIVARVVVPTGAEVVVVRGSEETEVVRVTEGEVVGIGATAGVLVVEIEVREGKLKKRRQQ